MRLASALLAIALSALVPQSFQAPARAEEAPAEESTPAPPVDVSTSEARKLVSAFDKAAKSARKRKPAEDRSAALGEALAALASGRHDLVARRLVDAAADDDVDTPNRIAALDALALQGNAATKHASRLENWLRSEAEHEEGERRRGRIGLPVDPRTGDPVTDTPEAKEALRLGEERARLFAAALRTARTLDHVPKQASELLRPHLQSPYDDLAVAAIETARAWDARDVTEELGLLLRMYPRHDRWETGAVTHLSGTDATAKAAWIGLFGHPLKQRHRPEVHKAVVACLSDWAGSPITGPDAFDAWWGQGGK